MHYSVKNVYRKREKVCQKYHTRRFSLWDTSVGLSGYSTKIKKNRRLWKMCVEACPLILYNMKVGISAGICDGEKIG